MAIFTIETIAGGWDLVPVGRPHRNWRLVSGSVVLQNKMVSHFANAREQGIIVPLLCDRG